jgi:hypothetical protein
MPGCLVYYPSKLGKALPVVLTQVHQYINANTEQNRLQINKHRPAWGLLRRKTILLSPPSTSPTTKHHAQAILPLEEASLFYPQVFDSLQNI